MWHVPDIRLNLIYGGKLDDEGYNNNFSDGKWKLSKGSLVVAKGKKTCSLYTMQAKICKGVVNTLENDSSTDLWHRRLGHMSEKGLQVLSKKELIVVSFRRNIASRKSHVLDLVRSDVCGPLKVRTLGGTLYFVTFIDDHFRKVWAYTLKTKDQVLDVFKHFKANVERETGRQLKCVRSDNGGEYIGPLDQYCTNHSIRHEKTVKKTPQQNGVVERMNRTILERVRCFLSHSKLPRSFWGEAMRTTVDLINLSPSVPLNGDVPEKFWTGKEVSYDHLRVFGCKAFVHIPKDERFKLIQKQSSTYFLAMGMRNLATGCVIQLTRKLSEAKIYVVFLEDQTIEDIEMLESADSSTDDHVDLDPLDPPIFHDINEEVQTPHDDASKDDVEPKIEGEQPLPQTPLRRSTREKQPSKKYSSNEYVMISDQGEPETYQEVLKHENKIEWLKAMKEEMESLHENHTYDLVKPLKEKKILKNKWVFRRKNDGNSSQPRFKARLVVKGFG